MPVPPGATELPGYVLLEPISEGGSGAVFRARQSDPDRIVAVKLIPLADPGPGAGAPDRPGPPTEVLLSLRHPNVVRIYDCGVHAGNPYLVMEYVEGGSLRTRIRPGRPWPAAEAVAVVNGVAAALGYVHGRGLLHLDLKPENLL